MEPLAVAGYVMVSAAAVLAVILGAFVGATAWLVKANLLWAALLAAGVYLAETVLLGSAGLAPAAVIGLPPLIMTLLASWLIARLAVTHARLRRIWAASVAFGCALTLGFLWGFTFRLGLWAPPSLALAADLCLLALFWRDQRTLAP